MTLTELPGPRPGQLGQKRQVGQNSPAQVGQYSWTQPLAEEHRAHTTIQASVRLH